MGRAALLLLLSAFPAVAAPTTFTIDPGQSELLAFTEPTGLFKGASHSHLIRAAKSVEGKVVYDAEAVGSSWVTVSFPVSGLVVDEPALRKREGMTHIPNDKDREEVTATMLSAKQLDQKHWAQISFDSSKVTATGEGKLEVTGKLGIHGVKANITVPITFTVTEGVFRGEGTVTFNHQDIGLEPITAVLGTVRNAEPIRLKVKLVGLSKAAP